MEHASVGDREEQRGGDLIWPPPGLENLQGAAAGLLPGFAGGALLYTVPLLLAVGTEQRYTSPGFFGSAFWFPLVAAVLGLIVLLAAALRTALLLRRASHAAGLGYDGSTIASVLADASRSGGRVLRGTHEFQALSADARRQLRLVRALLPLVRLAPFLWLPAGFTLAVVLAYFGALGQTALWSFTIVPAAILLLAAVLLHALEGTLLRPAQKKEIRQSTRAQLRHEAAAWRLAREILDDVEEGSTRPAAPALLAAGSLAVLLPVVLIAIPVYFLGASIVRGPIISSQFTDHLPSALRRVNALRPLRVYALQPDSSITPLAAGEALASIRHTGNAHRLERQPARAHTPVFENPYTPRQTPIGSVYEWPQKLFPALAASNREQRDFLHRLAQHPVTDDLARLARAPAIDIAGTRWAALPDSLSTLVWLETWVDARAASAAQLARAAQHWLNGDADAAERSLRLLTSAGIRIAHNGITHNDVLMGSIMASNGVHALASLYETAGRPDAARLVRAQLDAHRLVLETGYYQYLTRRDHSWLPRWPAPRRPAACSGWRTAQINEVARCANPHQVVFARDRTLEAWQRNTKQVLLRFPADAALYDALARGPFGAAPGFRCSVPREFGRVVAQLWR